MTTSRVLRPLIGMVVSVLATTCSYDDGNNAPNSGGSSGTGAQGGTQGAGGSTSGGTSAGGTAAGGVGAAGGATGGASASGGAGTGGSSAGTGGAGTGGSSAGTGGAGTGGSSAGTGGAGTGGSSAGSAGTGGAAGNPMGPCDIYAAASPATPCVAAYSTVRVLRSGHTGPLYQVRKGGPDPNTGSGGTTQDIGIAAGGFADAAAARRILRHQRMHGLDSLRPVRTGQQSHGCQEGLLRGDRI